MPDSLLYQCDYRLWRRRRRRRRRQSFQSIYNPVRSCSTQSDSLCRLSLLRDHFYHHLFVGELYPKRWSPLLGYRNPFCRRRSRGTYHANIIRWKHDRKSPDSSNRTKLSKPNRNNHNQSGSCPAGRQFPGILRTGSLRSLGGAYHHHRSHRRSRKPE